MYKLLEARGSRKDNLLTREFIARKLNIKAKFFFDWCDLVKIREPSATNKLSYEDVKAIAELPLLFDNPYRNQCVERFVKLVSKACFSVFCLLKLFSFLFKLQTR